MGTKKTLQAVPHRENPALFFVSSRFCLSKLLLCFLCFKKKKKKEREREKSTYSKVFFTVLSIWPHRIWT